MDAFRGGPSRSQLNAMELLAKLEAVPDDTQCVGLSSANEIVTEATFNNRTVKAHTAEPNFLDCQHHFKQALRESGIARDFSNVQEVKANLRSVIYQDKVNTYSKRAFKTNEDEQLYRHALAGERGSLTFNEIKAAIMMERLLPEDKQILRNHIAVMKASNKAVNFPVKLAEQVRQSILDGALCGGARNINASTYEGSATASKALIDYCNEELSRIDAINYPYFAAQAVVNVGKVILSLPNEDNGWENLNELVNRWPDSAKFILQKVWKDAGLHRRKPLEITTGFDRMLLNNCVLREEISKDEIEKIKALGISPDFLAKNKMFEKLLQFYCILKKLDIHVSLQDYIEMARHAKIDEQHLDSVIEMADLYGVVEELRDEVFSIFKECLLQHPFFRDYADTLGEPSVLLGQIDNKIITSSDFVRILGDAYHLSHLFALVGANRRLLKFDEVVSLINSGYFSSKGFLLNGSRLNEGAIHNEYIPGMREQLNTVYQNAITRQQTGEELSDEEEKLFYDQVTLQIKIAMNYAEELRPQENIDEDIHKEAERVARLTDGQDLAQITLLETTQKSTQFEAPFDPNLVCPLCMFNFKVGEIQLYKKHVALENDALVDDTLVDPAPAKPQPSSPPSPKPRLTPPPPVAKKRRMAVDGRGEYTSPSNIEIKKEKVLVEGTMRELTPKELNALKRNKILFSVVPNPVKLADIKTEEDLKKMTLISDPLGNRKVYTDGIRVFKVDFLKTKIDASKDLRLNNVLDVIYGGLHSQYAQFGIHQLQNKKWISYGPLLPGRVMSSRVEKIPGSLIEELHNYGFFGVDNKPENFWILPNENGEVLGPNDLGFDAKYVIPIDAKFIGDQSIHTHRHKHTPGGGDSMDFYKYDKIDPTK